MTSQRSSPPSDAELQLNRINGLKSELIIVENQARFTKQIVATNIRQLELDRDQKLKKLEAEYNSAQAAIRQEYTFNNQSLNCVLGRGLAGMQRHLATLHASLEREMAALPTPPIAKIPVEVLAQVFHWCSGGEYPSGQLASVCTSWKNILLGNASFWRRIKAEFVSKEEEARKSAQLCRRIELSGSVTLDVVLSTSNFRIPSSRQLFTILIGTDTNRWRSLEICDDGNIYLPKISFPFDLSFENLRSLTISHGGSDCYEQLYPSMVQSRPKIATLAVVNYLPRELASPELFEHVVDASGDEDELEQVGEFPSLRTLKMAMSDSLHTIKFALPPNLTLEGATWERLVGANMRHVVQLDITFAKDNEEAGSIELPNLASLIIRNGPLTYIKYLSAPKLVALEVGNTSHNDNARKKLSSRIFEMSTAPPQFSIRPENVTLYVCFTTKALLPILQVWPQLKHLTLVFDKAWGWKSFATRIGIKNNLLCPNLVSLRVAGFNEEELEKWELFAIKFLAGRREKGMKFIEWQTGSGKWKRLE